MPFTWDAITIKFLKQGHNVILACVLFYPGFPYIYLFIHFPSFFFRLENFILGPFRLP